MIAISIGDITGIGPEVTLKAVAKALRQSQSRFLLIGDAGHLEQLRARLRLRLSWRRYSQDQANGRVLVHQPLPGALPTKLVPGAPPAAQAALAWVKEGARLCLAGQTAALVTAPVNKEAIIRSGEKGFVGQTELLSGLAGTSRTAMMLLGHDHEGRWLRVALCTTHLALSRVPENVTRAKVQLAIRLASGACKHLGLRRARIAVCGLNPHAGEGGKMGTEEQRIIAPAIAAARKSGFDVTGPLPADALFYHALRGGCEAVVAMYHDQGLGPLKTVAFESGINWTLGLPFVRTSPDHGTAYDIAGKGTANPSSMLAAIELAEQLAKGRGAAKPLPW